MKYTGKNKEALQNAMAIDSRTRIVNRLPRVITANSLMVQKLLNNRRK